MILKTRRVIGMVAALALLAGPACAQQQHGQAQAGPWQPARPPAQHEMAPQQHQAYAAPRAPTPQAHAPVPQHSWHQGEHFTHNRVVVRDWGAHHLRQPPAGYEWVQDGNQYVLIAITSGIIASIIANAEAQ